MEKYILSTAENWCLVYQLELDDPELDPKFIRRARQLQKNKVTDGDLERFVNDYGTHYLEKVSNGMCRLF